MSTVAPQPQSGITPEPVISAGFGFWSAKALLSAVELGVFTELAKGPLAPEELSARLAVHPRAAPDLFDALVATGMLERTGNLYSNTPDSDLSIGKSRGRKEQGASALVTQALPYMGEKAISNHLR